MGSTEPSFGCGIAKCTSVLVCLLLCVPDCWLQETIVDLRTARATGNTWGGGLGCSVFQFTCVLYNSTDVL